MTQLFISYAREDADFMQTLVTSLKGRVVDGQTLQPWIDVEGIRKGELWLERLRQAIEASDTFIFIISPDSLSSQVCHVELAHARQENKRIIPIIRREPDHDALLHEWTGKTWEKTAKENWTILQATNWLFFRETDPFATRIEELVQAATTDLAYVDRHTQLVVAAKRWVESGRQAGYLLYDEELIDAEFWLLDAEDQQPSPTALQTEYIAASRDHASHRRKRTKRLQNIAWFLGTAALVGSIVAYGAVRDSQKSDKQANQAKQQQNQEQLEKNQTESRRLAGISAGLLTEGSDNVEVAGLLAIRAMNTAFTVEAETALQQAMVRLYTAYRLELPSGTTTVVGFSPDGQLGLTASTTGEVDLWEVATGQLRTRLTDHQQEIYDAAFSPDGRYLITGAADSTARVWDVASGQAIDIYDGHNGGVTTVSFSPDGQWALTGSMDGTAQVWDFLTGMLRQIFSGQILLGGGVTDAAFSPDGQRVLVGGDDGYAYLWDITTDEVIHQLGFASQFGGGAGPTTVAWSPDGQMALVGFPSGDSAVFSVDSGEQVASYEGISSDPFERTEVAFHPYEREVLTDIGLGAAQVWSLDGGYPVAYLSSDTDDDLGFTYPVNAVAFSTDGQWALSARADGSIKLQSLATFAPESSLILTGHTGPITAAAFSPDSQWVLTGDADGPARLWRIHDAELGQWQTIFTTAIAFSPDEQSVVVGDSEGKVHLWNVADDAMLREFSPATEFGDDINAVAFSPDGQWIAASSEDSTIHVWEAASGRLAQTLICEHEAIGSIGAYGVMFSPDSQRLVVGCGDDTGRVWEVATGDLVLTLSGHASGWDVTGVAFSPDGQWIATGSRDQTAILWNAENGDLVRRFEGHTNSVREVVFSPDGRQLLTASDDGTARLWEVTTGATLQVFAHDLSQRLPDGTYPIHAVFSPDGRFVVTAGQDVRVWDAKTGELLHDFANRLTRPAAISRLEWIKIISDGHKIMGGYDEGIIGEWPLDSNLVIEACQRIFRDLTVEERQQYAITDNSATCPQFIG